VKGDRDFKEGDVDDLKAKLCMISHDVYLQSRLRDRGLARVKERYNDTRIAANMIAIYEIALNMERSAPNTLEVDLVQ